MGKIAINIATGTLQKEDIIVGIDLGTTNSLVAAIHPESGKPVVLREHDGSALVPSVIYFNAAGDPVVGDEAKLSLIKDPKRTVFSAKRLLGKNYNDIKENASFFSYRIIENNSDDNVKVSIDDKFYTPAELSSLILKELKMRAEHILKTPVNRAVITVPAYFNDAQRQATRDAGRLAGLDVLRIINEPTAASLAYGIGLHKEEEKTIAVYDLGGGTFDISILRLSAGIFEVLSTNGDTYLGGDDIDQAIVSFWLSEMQVLAPADEIHKQSLRLKAEEAKKFLSSNELYSGTVNGVAVSLNRKQFNEISKDLIDRTITCCRMALKDAGLKVSEIDEVIMVGGSTRVPAVNDAVEFLFEKKVNNSMNPDEVVAAGAAIQADILAGNNKEMLLLDITPLSLGIETAGELMDVLIPRNAKIPTSSAREYTTQADAQSGMRITVYQGERDLVTDNRKLAEFNLKGIPAMPAGMAKVRVSFMINADGILTVSAKELRSGVEQTIEVKPQEGIKDTDVEKMLMDSIQNASSDIAARALAEARTEGDQLLKTTERFLQKNAESLTGSELTDTAAAMQALQLAITMNDKDLVQKKTEALNDVSRPYAERIMNAAVGEAMSGRKI